MSSFNFNARYALLTYAQCGDLDPHEVVCRLAELGAECIIARENHVDGGTHLHSFVDFGRKFRTRRVDTFDVGGHHPNISPSYGTPEKGYDYTIKDGDVVGGGLERPSRASVSKTPDIWAEIILAESRDEFFSLVGSLAPRALCTSFPSLSKYADWKYRVDPEPYRHDPQLGFDLTGAPELSQWSHDTFNETRRVGPLYLYVGYLTRRLRGATWSLTLLRFRGILPGGAPPPFSPLARGRLLRNLTRANPY
ncbi:replication-associated protein [Cattle blood-associated gemycircularvirus]|uniref:Replication-associated protein n=1 Tax=Cattle blood-associated gemycircularvirus TaxID=2077296 RepID=A0A2L0HGY2_9VIRU|nr:replication-associated protein [Cattle blood-associated gemycircularvirus]AUX80748.1 replication-associated protein [Cattle blood-associated gemycircularvirus]